jgi:hypothetical protein
MQARWPTPTIKKVFNPQNMSPEAYKDIMDYNKNSKNPMDPRGAPDFGGNWTTVRNEGSNTWGRKWTGAQDHEEGKKTWRGFNKPSETARDRTNTTVDQQIFEESIDSEKMA